MRRVKVPLDLRVKIIRGFLDGLNVIQIAKRLECNVEQVSYIGYDCNFLFTPPISKERPGRYGKSTFQCHRCERSIAVAGSFDVADSVLENAGWRKFSVYDRLSGGNESVWFCPNCS